MPPSVVSRCNTSESRTSYAAAKYPQSRIPGWPVSGWPLYGFADFTIEAFAQIFFGHADPQAPNRLLQLRHVIRNRQLGGSRIHGIASRNCSQHDGRVLHSLCKRPNVIERRGERDQSVTRNSSVGRHQSNHATKRCWLSNRASGIGAEGRHRHIRRHRRRRSA